MATNGGAFDILLNNKQIKMNILSPDTIWIEGICYRINDSHEIDRRDDYLPEQNEINANLDDLDDNFEFTTCNNGRIKTTIHVAQFFNGFIIGSKGATRRRIENETRTEIKVPPQGQRGDVSITGPDIKSVAAAARRINMIVLAARQKQKPTHFISIPINSSHIQENFSKFKEDILNENIREGIDLSIFVRTTKLHLTLLTLYLADNEERALASRLMEKAKDEIISPLLGGVNRLDLTLKNVSYMNDDPSSINVLYSEAEETDLNQRGLLTELGRKFYDYFFESGLMTSNNKSDIKFHMTLMNTKYRETEECENKPKRQTFDGRLILDKYANYEFGQQRIENIHLSQMNSPDGQDGYYPATTILYF